jgi:glycosyltransferase involved in cell wall biosynthesis
MDFVFFSVTNWDDQGGVHPPTQRSLALARRGHRILFVQILAWSRPSPRQNVRVTSLVELGLSESAIRRSWFGFDDADLEPVARSLAVCLAQFERADAGARVAIWAVPFVPFVRLFPLLVGHGYRTVYDCVDDFGGLYGLGRYFANPAAEEFLAGQVDLITGLSQTLVDKFRASRPNARVELLQDGADLNFRAREPAPPDLLRGELTLGFWGTIADYAVDADALAYVARQRPNWAINLIGAYDLDRARPSVANALHDLPNVRLLGRRPHATLMNYLAGFDVGLIPFPDNAFSRGRDPIKLYEYLAGYKPVVALNTPQLADIPYVKVATSPAEFLTQIEAARRTRVDRQVVDEFLSANSWEARGEKLLALVSTLRTPVGAQGVGAQHVEDLPQNPRDRGARGAAEGAAPLLPERFDDSASFAARMEAYLAHLEQTADERLAYIRELERQARDTDAYVKKLERTHPLVWLKRTMKRWRD